MELFDRKINFLGDSITEGYGTSGKGHTFCDLVAADTGAVCRNYGIAGTRTAKQRNPSADPSWDRDFCSRVAEMDADAAHYCRSWRDERLCHGDAPFGSI